MPNLGLYHCSCLELPTLTSRVADYVIFLSTLSDIMFWWCSNTHKSDPKKVSLEHDFWKYLEFATPDRNVVMNGSCLAHYVGCVTWLACCWKPWKIQGLNNSMVNKVLIIPPSSLINLKKKCTVNLSVKSGDEEARTVSFGIIVHQMCNWKWNFTKRNNRDPN